MEKKALDEPLASPGYSSHSSSEFATAAPGKLSRHSGLSDMPGIMEDVNEDDSGPNDSLDENVEPLEEEEGDEEEQCEY